MYQKPWIFAWNLRFSSRFCLKPIQSIPIIVHWNTVPDVPSTVHLPLSWRRGAFREGVRSGPVELNGAEVKTRGELWGSVVKYVKYLEQKLLKILENKRWNIINDGTSPKKEHSPENGRSIVGYNGTICSNRPKPFFAGIMCPQWYPKSGSSYAKKEQHQWFLTFHVLAQTRIHVKKWHTSPKIRGILYDMFMCRKIVCLKHVWGSIRKKCGTMWPSRQLWPSRNAGQFLLLLGPLTSYYGSKPWYSSPEQPVNKWSFP